MTRYHSYWNTELVFLSLGLSMLGALTGVMLMDQRRESKSPRVKAMLTLATAFAFGGVGLYGMNTVAIVSLELVEPNGTPVPIGYDVKVLFFIFLIAVVFMYVGLLVASTDRFFGMTREQRLKELIADVKRLTSNNITVKRLMREVEYRALFGDLRRIALGGCLTVFGIYTVAGGGIGAMNGNLTFNPSPGGIFGIIVLPFFTATFSYWIIFRVNEWRRKESWLRIVSAVILGVAFAFTRSVVYVGAKYYATDSFKPISVNKTNVTLFTVTASLLYSLVCFTAIVLLQRNFIMDVQEDLGNLHRFYLQLRTFYSSGHGDDPTYLYRVEAFLSQFGIMMAKQSDKKGLKRQRSAMQSNSDWEAGEDRHESACAPLIHYCLPWARRTGGAHSRRPGSFRTAGNAWPNKVTPTSDGYGLHSDDGQGRDVEGQQGGASFANPLEDASRNTPRSRAPSILLSSVLPEFRPGAAILSTIIEEDEDSESFAESGPIVDNGNNGSLSNARYAMSAGDATPNDILPGEVVIKVKQVNDTTVMVTQTTNVDGALRKKSIKYECVDKQQEEPNQPREAPVPFMSEDPKKSTFSSTMTRLKKEMTSGRLDMSGGDDKTEPKGDNSSMSSSQLDDEDLETLAQMSLGMLEGKKSDSTGRELEPRKKSVTMPQSMLVFSSNSSFGPAVNMTSGMASMGQATGMLNLAHLTGNLGKMQQNMQPMQNSVTSTTHATSSGKMIIEVTETTEPMPTYATPRRPSQSHQPPPQVQPPPQQPQSPSPHSVERAGVHSHQPVHLPPLHNNSVSPRAQAAEAGADDDGGPSIV